MNSEVKQMAVMDFSEMFRLQEELRARHPEWGGLFPERAKDQLLWTYEEMGEIVAIFKKKELSEILEPGAVRSCFLEELCDVFMYLSDVMLCMGVTPEELTEAYRGKFHYNMKRDWEKQNAVLFTHSSLEESET